MQSDPERTPEMRVLLIIGGVIVFGTPIYVILARLFGMNNATIAVAIVLAIVGFITARRYFERRRLDKLSTNQPYRSTRTTRDWPRKYAKHGQRSYNAAVNLPRKPEPTPQSNLLKILRLTLKPLQFVMHILSSRTIGEVRRDELSHRQTRHTMW